jgi:hypothetical protein
MLDQSITASLRLAQQRRQYVAAVRRITGGQLLPRERGEGGTELLTRRTDSGGAWNWTGPLIESGISFPLTPTLPLGERENHRPRYNKSKRSGIFGDGRRGTLSLREGWGEGGTGLTSFPRGQDV